MGYGMPYMGSKSDIAASVALNFPAADNFYDLFGGGCAMTHYMMINKGHRYKHFHYNEIESTTVNLLRKAINGDFSYDKFKPEWISREDFFARKDTDAYVRCLWSFGNNQKQYLFGEDIEPYKKSMHMAVVFDEFDELAQDVLELNKWPSIAKTPVQKRFYLRQKIEWYRVNKRIPKVLFQFLNENELLQIHGKLKKPNIGAYIPQLKQLQRLQQLEQLKQLERLTLSALSYEQVDIKPNSVVYCDIPYAGTGKDKSTGGYLKVFNHQKFFDWAATREFPVFISEYNVPDSRFKLIYSVSKTVKMSSQGMTKESADLSREKLYWNGK